jgi:glycerol-3-phosphate dehydrogenase subunit C
MKTILPDACLGCAACETACPVTASDGRFAGPKVLGPAFIRRLEGGWPGEPPLSPDEAEALGAHLCLQCHQCDLACPAAVPVSALTGRAKALARSVPNGRYRAFVDGLLVDQERFGRLVAAGAIGRRALHGLSRGLGRGAESLGLGLLGLSPSRSLPLPAAQSFPAWFGRNRLSPADAAGRPPVILFAGCHARFHDPAAGKAAVNLLHASGFRVVLPRQVCCGSPADGSGAEDAAALAASANLRLLTHASGRLGSGVPIITPCPSCTLSLRETLPELTGDEAARNLSRQVWDLGEFLTGPGHRGLIEALDRTSGPPSGLAWAYHTPCHLRALGVGRPFMSLFEEFRLGTRVDAGPAADECCGMGGLSGLTRAGYGRSLASGARALEAYSALARSPEPPVLLSDCPLCRWQISDLSGLEAAHPAEILARAATAPTRKT